MDPYRSDDDGLDPKRRGDTRVYFGSLMPKEWRFMYNWFELVATRVSFAEDRRLDTHAVEIGRDLENDLSIEVEHENGGLIYKYDELADDSIKRYRTVREMLILTSMLAEVDYKMWYEELRRGSRLLPVRFINIKTMQLQRKYTFCFYHSENPDEFSWESLQNLFAHDNFSDDFQNDYAKTCLLAAQQGCDVAAKLRSIPIQFRIKLQKNDTRTDQIEILRNLTETITKILELENALQDGDVPVFHLESIDLDLRKFSHHTTVLKEIQKLVETGVHVKALGLPQRGAKHSQETEKKERVVWASFLCAITGQPQPVKKATAAASKKKTNKRPVRVSRLVLPAIYPVENWALPLCSVLATAQCGLTSVRFEHSIVERGDPDDQQWRFWAWIAYALFSPNAASSSKGNRIRIPNG